MWTDKDALAAARKECAKVALKLSPLVHRLWACEDRLQASAARPEGSAEGEELAAERALAALVGRILVDRLHPALQALESLGEGKWPDAARASTRPEA
jgi:hypothetical protein